jgi:nanoRNase/pAp phosphatase (c-di-AMP/oligoRNAs hydrolase)
VLAAFSIENGGGHPGAIGFRLPAAEIPDPASYCAAFAGRLASLVSETLMGEAPAN